MLTVIGGHQRGFGTLSGKDLSGQEALFKPDPVTMLMHGGSISLAREGNCMMGFRLAPTQKPISEAPSAILLNPLTPGQSRGLRGACHLLLLRYIGS